MSKKSHGKDINVYFVLNPFCRYLMENANI
jgi:hypothetical protein